MKCKPFPYSDLLAVAADGKEFAMGIADQPKSPTKYSLALAGGKEGKYGREEEGQEYSYYTKPMLRAARHN